MLASRERVQQIKLQRTLVPSEVKDNILRDFKEFKISSFVVLDTIDFDHTLVHADEQEIDGENAINRRGSLFQPQGSALRGIIVRRCACA